MKILLKSIYPYLFLFFCFVLPLDKYATAVPNIILIALLVAFPFVVTKENFRKLLKREFLMFGGLLLFVTLSSLLFLDFESDVNIIKKMGAALLLIILYLPLEKTENLKKTIIASVLVCLAISIYHLYWFYTKEGEFNFATGSYINDVLIVDRLYLGFLCVMSIVSSIGLIGNKYNDYNKWYFANIVLCVLFVLLISSRSAIVLLLILFLLKIFYSTRKKEFLFFFLGIATITVIAFVTNKNLGDRFFYSYTTMTDKSYTELVLAKEPRAIIWKCNYNIAKNESFLLTGLGFYKTKDLLVDCFKDEITTDIERQKYFVRSRFNPHNQFFDFFLSTGIIGLVLFTAIFVSLFLRNWRRFFPTALLITMFFFAFIESFFHRQLGAFYFGIFLIFLLGQTKNNTEKIE